MSTTDLFKVGYRAPAKFEISRDFEFFDKDLTDQRKKDALDKVEPIFVFREDKRQEMIADFRQFADFILPLASEDLADDVYLSRASRRLNSRQVEIVPQQDLIYLNTLSTRQLDDFLKTIESNIDKVSNIPLVNDDRILQRFTTSNISIYKRNSGNVERFFIDMSKHSQGSNIDSEINKVIASLGSLRFSKDIIFNFTKAFIVANTFFSDDETKKAKDSAMAEVVEEKKFFPADTVIVNENEIVTERHRQVIDSYNKFLVGQANLINVLGLIFAAVLIGVSLKLIFRPSLLKVRLKISDRIILLFSGYLILIPAVITSHYGLAAPWMQSVYFIPFIISVLLVTILINSLSAIFFIIILALVNLIFLGVNDTFLIYMIYIGVVSAIFAGGVESPTQLMKVMVKILIASLSYVIILSFFENLAPLKILILCAIITLNVFASVLMTMGFVHFLEIIFNLATPFRLMELANTNLPIFKQMFTLAPGTYSHSMHVAHLAESGCREIGANGLLARVGSYYHDIGKIDQAEYFVENQNLSNKHDDLRPELSVAVIKSHVKKGVEKAKEIKLPDEVIDIIEQHHGNGIILYFYARAINGLDKDKNTILSDDYRYKTPLPQSREAAVVMLADCVEAASRTLKNPTISQLEKFVWKIMTDKFDNMQLSETAINFKELEAVKNVFVKILAGNMHSRIAYPEETKGE
ncbi:MAG: HDIG domain-containing protein [Spirochaetales bacterium]|nr:HDIG domain-containing protein [Spirochaetales bacterium]